jgi:molybdopterin converting factor small subunit
VSLPELVEIHLYAAARAAAGTSRLDVAAGTLGEVLGRAVDASPDLAPVLARCSFLVDEVAVRPGDLDRQLAPGARLDVLPPFAGG